MDQRQTELPFVKWLYEEQNKKESQGFDFYKNQNPTKNQIPIQNQTQNQKHNSIQKKKHKQKQKQTDQKFQSYSQSFKNLEDPRKFIKDKKISNLNAQEQQFKQTRAKIKQQTSNIQQLSKSIYKKVITRDNLDFDRIIKNLDSKYNQDNIDSWQYHSITNRKKKQIKKKVKTQQNKNFKFSTLYANQNDDITTTDEKSLTIDQIKLIQTPDFDNKCNNVQFYQLLANSSPLQKNRATIFNFSELESLQLILKQFEFNLIKKDQSLLDQKSHMVAFKADKQMRFWIPSPGKFIRQDLQILGQCFNIKFNNPNCFDFLDLASAFITPDELYKFNEMKKQHENKKRVNQNNENLQKKYQKVKMQLQYFKDTKLRNKAPRLPIKYADNYAQTLNHLQEVSFSDQIQQNIQVIQYKLKEMKRIRDQALVRQEKSTQRVMLVNINEQIRWILFQLLCFIINNSGVQNAQKIISSYQQLNKLNNVKQAQKMILDFIHQNYDKFKNQKIEGRYKLQLIDLYLKQRKQAQKYKEIIQNKWI